MKKKTTTNIGVNTINSILQMDFTSRHCQAYIRQSSRAIKTCAGNENKNLIEGIKNVKKTHISAPISIKGLELTSSGSGWR